MFYSPGIPTLVDVNPLYFFQPARETGAGVFDTAENFAELIGPTPFSPWQTILFSLSGSGESSWMLP